MVSNARRLLNFELYKKLLFDPKNRRKIIEHYPENEMKTPMHLYLGGEAIAAGVCHALGQNNQVFCTYRSHGVYLANTMETKRFFGELCGKATGMAKEEADQCICLRLKPDFLEHRLLLQASYRLPLVRRLPINTVTTEKLSLFFSVTVLWKKAIFGKP